MASLEGTSTHRQPEQGARATSGWYNFASMGGLRSRASGAAALLCAAGAVAGCGGGERQDAGEAAARYKVEITDASFPAKQAIADATKLRISVRNEGTKTAPNVAVTVGTDPGRSGGSAQSFSQAIGDPDVSDSSRPIWIVDEGPSGGDTASNNTWALGPLKAGQAKDFEWRLTAVKAGDYTVRYSVSPGLYGKSRVDGGTTKGIFHVTVDDTPPAASVDGDGNVVREQPGSDN